MAIARRVVRPVSHVITWSVGKSMADVRNLVVLVDLGKVSKDE